MKQTNQLLLYYFCISLLFLFSCDSDTNQTENKLKTYKKISAPEFVADSAYEYIARQVAFGPRVPNTTSHDSCALYLMQHFKQYSDNVIVQHAKVRAYDGTMLSIKNIIAQFQPEKNNRILLFAHWDTRPFADHDPDSTKQNMPIDGANDGGSGTGVLMEIGRHLSKTRPYFGIDIILFDAEDYGQPDHIELDYKPDTWCLGSQYWAKNPHKLRYNAFYGILLDMVGGKNAVFTQERNSVYYAPGLLEKVWANAHALGYGKYFSYQKTPPITDDHLYINRILNIPCIDIIPYDESAKSSFGDFWHTHNDNMDIISKETLKAVGQTVLETIYSEHPVF